MAFFNSFGLAPTLIAMTASSAAGILSSWMFVGSVGAKGLPGCGAGSGCDAVTRSRWSRWGPYSVSIFGAIAYFAVAALAVIANFTTFPQLNDLLICLSLITLGSAIWFMSIQVVVLRQLCAYCTVTHACATLASIILLGVIAPWNTAVFPIECMISGAALILLVGGQILLKPRTYLVVDTPESLPPPKSVSTAEQSPPWPRRLAILSGPKMTVARRMRFLRGKVDLNSSDFPLIGSTNASEFIAFLFDYTCTECHHLHRLLVQAVEDSAGTLAVVIVPVPLHFSCNPAIECNKPEFKISCAYTRLGWAVWAAGIETYRQWHDFLITEDEPKPFGLSLIRAKELADISRFELKEPDSKLDPKIAAAVTIYHNAGVPDLPTLLLPVGMLRGHIPDLQNLKELLMKHVSSGLFPAKATVFLHKVR